MNYEKNPLNLGQKFGGLTVLNRNFEKKNSSFYNCLCDCGNYSVTTKSKLLTGHTKSCGKCTMDGIVTYEFDGNICKGTFSISKDFFIIDKEDYEKIKNKNMSIKRDINTNYITVYSKNKIISLHKFIMNPKKGEFIDHINRNGTDNRKENLRICTKQQNAFNHKRFKTNKSGYTGVTWNKDKQKWIAQLTFNGQNKVLGSSINKEEAIKKRLLGELKYFGKDFAPQRKLFKKYEIQ